MITEITYHYILKIFIHTICQNLVEIELQGNLKNLRKALFRASADSKVLQFL